MNIEGDTSVQSKLSALLVNVRNFLYSVLFCILFFFDWKIVTNWRHLAGLIDYVQSDLISIYLSLSVSFYLYSSLDWFTLSNLSIYLYSSHHVYSLSISVTYLLHHQHSFIIYSSLKQTKTIALATLALAARLQNVSHTGKYWFTEETATDQVGRRQTTCGLSSLSLLCERQTYFLKQSLVQSSKMTCAGTGLNLSPPLVA